MALLSRRNFLYGTAASTAMLGMLGGLGGCSTADNTKESQDVDLSRIADQDLISKAQAEKELIVYGSAEEPFVAAACNNFQKLFGITTKFMRLSTGEVQAKIEEENGNPSGDVWFGGTTDPYNIAASKGLLEPYEARNATHLLSPHYKDDHNYWYGIYKGSLGFFYNKAELDRRSLEAPSDWPDLLKPEYKGLIWSSNYNTAGTAKLLINTMIQKYDHDKGIKYLVDLDKNIAVYSKSGVGPAQNVGTGECTIGIGFVSLAIKQIVTNGYKDIRIVIPSSGTSYEIGATAIIKGCKHPYAAQLWIEYALSPQCVERAQEVGSNPFLVIDDAQQPPLAAEFGLDPNNVMDYDFEDAKKNTERYVHEVMQALKGGDSRFKTK